MAGDSDRLGDCQSFIEDDDDDCVIFKGSPLYESLIQSGYKMTENEVESSVKSELLQSQDSNKLQQHKQNEVGMNTQTVFTRLKQQMMYFYRRILSSFTSQLNRKYQVKQNNLLILERLKKCSTLDEDDADFIEWFIDTPHIGDVTNKSEIVKWLCVGVIPVLVSYSYMRIFHTVTFGKMVWCTDLGAALCSSYLMVQTVLQLVNTLQIQKYKQEGACVDNLLGGSEKFMTALRKSLRLIQETELIARGFTLVSQRNPLSRLEEGKRQTVRQCPALRKLLFTCSCESIHQLREKTKCLLQQLPHNPEIDVKSGYLAFEPIENYGPCLQMTSGDSTADGHIYTLTDGYSVSALKGISHLLMLHLSEFIKGLTIFYHQDYKHTELNHDQVLNMVRDLSSKITSRTDSIQRSIDFHNSSFLRKDREQTPGKEKTENSDLYTAVHSLDLHLQSALMRVRSLSLEIESHDHIEDLSHDQINERMQPIRAELTSCNNCFAEALSRLEQLMGQAKMEDVETEKLSVQSHLDKEKTRENVKEIEDYIIVDQVFEAYTDPDEMGMADGDWAKPLTAEEKEKKLKEKEEALRMMSELKSVIKVRAKDTEKRETAALSRSKTGGKESLSTEMETIQKEESKLNSCSEKTNPTITIDEDKIGKEPSNIDVDLKKQSGISERLDEFKAKSVVTKLGVRRLRKGNMLDDSDSDEDIVDNDLVRTTIKYPLKVNNTLNLSDQTAAPNDDIGNVDNISNIKDDVQNVAGIEDVEANSFPIKHEPMFDETKGEDLFIGDASDIDVTDDGFNGISNPNLIGVTLEERLARYSGLDFCLTSNIASMAAARSREFVKQGETTFGEEDEYGELSDEESNDGDM